MPRIHTPAVVALVTDQMVVWNELVYELVTDAVGVADALVSPTTADTAVSSLRIDRTNPNPTVIRINGYIDLGPEPRF
jgi:hypothetical protein